MCTPPRSRCGRSAELSNRVVRHLWRIPSVQDAVAVRMATNKLMICDVRMRCSCKLFVSHKRRIGLAIYLVAIVVIAAIAGLYRKLYIVFRHEVLLIVFSVHPQYVPRFWCRAREIMGPSNLAIVELP